jgi:carboxyl-terminal processing protease
MNFQLQLIFTPMLRYLLLLLLLFTFSTVYSQSNEGKTSNGYKLLEVLNYVDKLYVDDVNENEITEAAINSMLEKLDPHSVYISKDDVNDANERINGSFVGIGVRFQILKDTLMVVATIPGGPSERLGILAGDKIVKISGENVAGTGLKNSEVREKLLGELGTKVKVEVVRKNERKPINFNITRNHIPLHSVDCYYMLTPEIGYLKLNSFSRNTVDEVQEGLKSLKSQGMKELIFDLQGNGGGLLYAAQKVADEFLSGDKLIVYSEGRSQPRSDLRAENNGLWENGKLVILTDEYSASASEILTGAVQDWDRGLIVGRRTYGKGLVQRPIDLSDGSQLRLTIARYYTPSGRFIQKPYTDVEAYKKDLVQRYMNGEFLHVDSIHFPDSLKKTTLLSKRIVYSGGGIMPDIFVPLDTLDITNYFRSLISGGHVNNFILTYANDNRVDLKNTYPEFNTFKSSFVCDDKFMKEFFAYVSKEQPELEYNQSEFETSSRLIQLRMKALLAQNLWGYSEFYQIYNETNEILIEAIRVLESNKYDEMKLAHLNEKK